MIGAPARLRGSVLALAAGAWLTVIGTAAAAEDLSRYRGHVLGESVAEVVAKVKARAGDVVTVHERPASVQQLDWRPPFASARDDEADPVEAIRFAFVDGRLYELTISYVHARTKGLTAADLVAGVEAVYGPPLPREGRAPAAQGEATGSTVLGRWQQPEASLTLVRGTYDDVQLIVRSSALAGQASDAIRTALAMDTAEAPARARQAGAALEAAAAAERARNRTRFRP
jgi:hypothetical protein